MAKLIEKIFVLPQLMVTRNTHEQKGSCPDFFWVGEKPDGQQNIVSNTYNKQRERKCKNQLCKFILLIVSFSLSDEDSLDTIKTTTN